MKFRNIALILLITNCYPAICQGLENMQEAGKDDALKVFFKASEDDEFSMEFIKTEIPVVNYVRDQADAEFHIIATSQNTGTQGKVYSFYLIGKQEFEGKLDTVSYTSSPDDTREKIYEGQVAALKMGLLPYILQTPQASRVKISFADGDPEQPTEDPWKSWVITVYAGADANGEKTRNYFNLWGGFSIEKVTPEWKFELVTDFGNQLERFEIDEEEVTSRHTARIGEMILAKSLGEHWSVGAQGFLGAFSFYNYRLKSNLFPVIEYNLFPYSESARRQVRFMYGIGFAGNLYNDTTIYDKLEEFLWGHRLDIAAEMIQQWGSLSAYLGWKNYLHDWNLNNLYFSGAVNLRITKGLQIRLNSGISLIHDQIYLAKGEATREEILLRQVQLETQYSFHANISFRYTFGSIYDRVVNPRFDSLERW
jgi:hypothetical protein